MPTLNKPPKKRPGRPKKAPADKPEQFSVRLSPRLKFGLELLARAQNRSLSQVVEWAVQMGMNSYEVGRDFESLTELLDAAWKHPEEGRRLIEVYRAAPALLTYEDAAVCELVDRSTDPGELEELLRAEMAAEHEVMTMTPERRWLAMQDARDRLYWGVVWLHWEELKRKAVALSDSGKTLQMQSVAKLLGLSPPEPSGSVLDAYRAELLKS